MKSSRVIIYLTIVSVIYSNHICSQTKNNKPTIKAIDHVQYEASYNYDCQEDSADITSRKLAIMNLYIGKNISKFEHSNRYTRDSLWLHCELEGRAKTQFIINQIKGNLRHMHAQYQITKQLNGPQVNLYERILRQYYSISEDINFDWQLINNKDTIITGYKCHEAQTVFRGRKYRAWYTLSIPISDGPYKFKGLPGLIIKLEDTNKEHCFELEALTEIKYEKPIYLSSQNYIETDPTQYPKLKRNEAQQRMRKIDNGQVANLAPEQKGEIEAKILRRNNTMERL